jgi:response regulator RpfG family c-di-GMP phosphodiesterase
VGVVEVLSKYLQSSNPRTKARSIRIAELCQAVAHRMRLSRKRIDDIRVAALLRDLESVEISTKLISRAVDTLERNASKTPRHTFLGTDLVHSLGTVLESALPLIVSQNDDLRDCVTLEGDGEENDIAVGAKIISAVRAYVGLTYGDASQSSLEPTRAIERLRTELGAPFERIIDALASVVGQSAHVQAAEPAQT